VTAARERRSRQGTLMRKIQRQSRRVSRPPTIGPEVDATEPPNAQTATARPRWTVSGYDWLIRVRVAGMITAAAAPWTSRATTSRPSVGAAPQVTDATVNSATPTVKARRAPNLSARDPEDRSRAANSRVYPSTTHCRPVMPPPRPSRIDGRATLTTTASRVTTKKPRIAAARAKAARGSAAFSLVPALAVVVVVVVVVAVVVVMRASLVPDRFYPLTPG
jgi:hypothetical protein